jgi:amino acid adenylation domain-containing protein
MLVAQCSPQDSFTPIGAREIEESIPDRFREQVTREPSNIAVRAADRRWSYADLDRWSDAIAWTLLQRLDTRTEPVPFLLPQGPLAIATTLGILKTGKFYVPLDPSWGPERARALSSEISARLVLVNTEFAHALRGHLASALVLELPEEPPASAATLPRIEVAPDQPAYVYFTSGSTGRPKGVVDCHRNVLHNVMRYTNALKIVKSDRLSLLQSCGFSGAVSSMFGAILNGASSCPVDIRAETPAGLANWLDELAVTIYHSVPSIFRSLTSPGRVFRNVRVVRLEGDRATRLDLELFRTHFAKPCVLAIGLGATETGLVCQYFFDHGSCLPDGVVPIGYPVEGMGFEVRDERGNRVPTGQTGEIVVRSRFLATGYWNDADATARAFDEPFPGSQERAYRTGDLGRIVDGGCLEYLGRLDGRAKIRGQWVDIADVEVALCALPNVREAAVVVRGEEGAAAHLVGYYTTRSRPGPTISELRRQLAARLPPHMLPSSFVALETLPLNAYGKVDRGALPAPQAVRPNLDSALIAPRNLVEQRLVELWEEMLEIRPIGIRDDFFDLGGNSLLAVSMMDRIEDIFGQKIPLSTLLRKATIEGLAAAMLLDTTFLSASIVAIRRTGTRQPFFFLHGDYLSGGFYCRELARHLDPCQPFYALPPAGVDGGAMPSAYEAMAETHLAAIRTIQPRGPYLIGGECNGGLVAYEIARRLETAGECVGLLTLLSASAENLRFARLASLVHVLGQAFGVSPAKRRYVFGRLHMFVANLPVASPGALVRGLCRKLHVIPAELSRLAQKWDEYGWIELDPASISPEAFRNRLQETYHQIDQSYLPGPYGGSVTLILGMEEPIDATSERMWWEKVAAHVDLIEVPGDRSTKLTRHLVDLAGALNGLLDEAQRTVSSSNE